MREQDTAATSLASRYPLAAKHAAFPSPTARSVFSELASAPGASSTGSCPWLGYRRGRAGPAASLIRAGSRRAKSWPIALSTGGGERRLPARQS
jgi:hypothetical protein